MNLLVKPSYTAKSDAALLEACQVDHCGDVKERCSFVRDSRATSWWAQRSRWGLGSCSPARGL